MLNITYRKALPADAPAICEAQIKMALETERLTLDPATCEKGVRGVFTDPTRGTYFIAEEKDSHRFLGCLLTIKEWSDWRNGEVWWIHSVYVIPEARGKKVYRGLYEHVQSLVKQSENLRGLRLYVDKTNLPAQEVYEKLGMNGEHYHLYEWMKTF